jgi:hypothetical protein
MDSGQALPSIHFKWGYPKEKNGVKLPPKLRGKRRLIGHPNNAMRKLHELFEVKLRQALDDMGEDGKWLRILPSATGCVKNGNPLKNSEKHIHGEFSFITDFKDAYPSVDVERLALLLTFIFRYSEYGVTYTLDNFAHSELAHFQIRQDPLFKHMHGFVVFAFAGLLGRGLAVGGPLSPLLLNLYCEVFLDSRLRRYFYKKYNMLTPSRNVVYTRYVDDLVFSRGTPIGEGIRSDIRQFIEDAGFMVNHLKSHVRWRAKGTIFITKIGMHEPEADVKVTSDEETYKEPNPAILVFPQKKRRRIHGIIQSYLEGYKWNDSPEIIRGIIAEFIHYYKHVVTPTKTDEKTLALCKEFEKVSAPYRKRYKERPKRRKAR